MGTRCAPLLARRSDQLSSSVQDMESSRVAATNLLLTAGKSACVWC